MTEKPMTPKRRIELTDIGKPDLGEYGKKPTLYCSTQQQLMGEAILELSSEIRRLRRELKNR